MLIFSTSLSHDILLNKTLSTTVHDRQKKIKFGWYKRLKWKWKKDGKRKISIKSHIAQNSDLNLDRFCIIYK